MKKNPFFIILIVIVVLVLFCPIPLQYKDGGTVEYKALTYSVRNLHSIRNNTKGSSWYVPEIEEGAPGYIVGLEVEILGVKIYDNTKFEKAEEDQSGEIESYFVGDADTLE